MHRYTLIVFALALTAAVLTVGVAAALPDGMVYAPATLAVLLGLALAVRFWLGRR